MAIEMMQLDGMPISDVMTQIKSTGVSDAEASLILGNWLIETGASSQRIFNFKTTFSESNAEIAATFVPTFHHTDWVDGESVVQAQATTGEEGFNSRFHKIEADLVSIQSDLARAFQATLQMRTDISSMLQEVRTQINAINADLYNSRVSSPIPFAGFSQSYIPPFDASAAKFMGATKYFNQDVNVWQTSQGTIMLPAVTPVTSNPASDPRVAGTAGLAKFFSSRPDVQAAFAGKQVTKADLVRQFGNQVLDGGITVADAVSILPDSATFPSSDALVSDVAERQAGAIRSGGGADLVNATLGVQGAQGAAASAPVQNIPGMTGTAAASLAKSGITTVGQLANANTADVAKALQTGGVSMAPGDVAAMSAVAKTFNHI